MIQKRELFEYGKLELTLQRLVHQLLERYPDMSEVCFLGVQPRGIYLARRIEKMLSEHLPGQNLLFGDLDVTFYRDDFRRHTTPLLPNSTRVDFLVEDKNVILIDDVLYTGRTIRAAMDAMLAFGRPRKVELLVLIDRYHQRHLPIAPDYVGVKALTTDKQAIYVEWLEKHGRDSVRIENKA